MQNLWQTPLLPRGAPPASYTLEEVSWPGGQDAGHQIKRVPVQIPVHTVSCLGDEINNPVPVCYWNLYVIAPTAVDDGCHGKKSDRCG